MRFLHSLLVALVLLGPAFSQKAADETPTAFFLRFESVWDKAKSVEELAPLMAKPTRDQIAETPPEMRKEMFEFMTEMRATKVKVTSESRNGDTATVMATGVDSEGDEVKGTISLEIENGEWRLAKQSWESGPE